MPLIYLIAGEQSGDVLGARLMHAIRAQRPDILFAGIGGSAMAAQGLVSLFPIRALSLMGLLEVLPKILELRALLKRTVADIRTRGAGRPRHDRFSRIYTARAAGTERHLDQAGALRGAAGLGLAGEPGEALPRPVG